MNKELKTDCQTRWQLIAVNVSIHGFRLSAVDSHSFDISRLNSNELDSHELLAEKKSFISLIDVMNLWKLSTQLSSQLMKWLFVVFISFYGSRCRSRLQSHVICLTNSESIHVSIVTKHNKHVRRVRCSHFYHLAKRYYIIFGLENNNFTLHNHVGHTFGGEAKR